VILGDVGFVETEKLAEQDPNLVERQGSILKPIGSQCLDDPSALITTRASVKQGRRCSRHRGKLSVISIDLLFGEGSAELADAIFYRKRDQLHDFWVVVRHQLQRIVQELGVDGFGVFR